MKMVTSVMLGCALATCCTVVSAGPNPTSATLYGFINSNRTLTRNYPGPVYDVLGDLVVMPGVTLTVEPGVTLRMGASDTLQGGEDPTLIELEMRGTLIAETNAMDSIAFVSATPNGAWGGIRLQPGALARLEGVSIRNPRVGLKALPGSSAILRSCQVSNNGTFNISGFRGGETGLDASGGNIDMSPPAADSLSPVPTIVDGFYLGVFAGVVRNAILANCYAGCSATLAYYCTAYKCRNVGISANSSVNCIAAYCGIGGYTDYSNIWPSGYGVSYPNYGAHVAFFNPFFINADAGDFRLASGSVFKFFSATGNEIGAFGPGPGGTVSVTRTTWGRIKLNAH